MGDPEFSASSSPEALQTLPPNLKRNNPLLRSVKGIRAEIQQARERLSQ